MPYLLRLGLFLMPFLVGPAVARGEPVFTFEDMLGVRTFAGGQPIAISPDGKWIAYVLTDMEDEWNVLEPRPTGHVHVKSLDAGSGEARPLTKGILHSSFPVWSPDGKKLAFFEEGATGGRLFVWDRETDRARPLGEAFTGRSYLAPRWDRGGTRVVYATPAREPESGPGPRVEVVRSTDARIPGDAFFIDARKAGLAVVNVTSGQNIRLLPEPILLRALRLAAGGAFAIYTSPTPDTFGVVGKEKTEAFRVPLEGGPTERTASEEARPEEKLWSDDGRHYLRLVPDSTIQDPEIEPPQTGMYTISRPFMDVYLGSAGGGEERNLTSSFPDNASDPVFSPDGKALFFKATQNETYDETLYRYSIDDGVLSVLARGQESYDNIMAAPGRLALTIQDATHAPDLFVIDLTTGQRRRVTNLNPEHARFRFSKPDMFTFHSADGEKLAALLYKPVNGTPEKRAPVITWVYEKLTPGIHRFNARNQVFLNQGYALLLPNVKVKVGETATSFVKCAVPAVNKVREMGFTNGRFGLWGHSFGAYATSYVITQTDVFACAVSGATPPELFRNWASGRDRDSQNIEHGQARMGGSPFDYPERYLSQSAFFHLNRVRTPVLILHGKKDLTILFGEGEMMFYALRQLGKEATFVSYAEGDHSLSRHSRADTLDVNRRILEWFDKYLKAEGRRETQ